MAKPKLFDKILEGRKKIEWHKGYMEGYTKATIKTLELLEEVMGSYSTLAKKRNKLEKTQYEIDEFDRPFLRNLAAKIKKESDKLD